MCAPSRSLFVPGGSTSQKHFGKGWQKERDWWEVHVESRKRGGKRHSFEVTHPVGGTFCVTTVTEGRASYSHYPITYVCFQLAVCVKNNTFEKWRNRELAMKEPGVCRTMCESLQGCTFTRCSFEDAVWEIAINHFQEFCWQNWVNCNYPQKKCTSLNVCFCMRLFKG